MKNANHSSLAPFAVFIAIVGVLLLPLSRLGATYAWPCGRIAVSVCFFYIGCLFAEWLKSKLNSKALVAVGVAFAICFGQKYVLESITQSPPYDQVFWYHRYLSSIVWVIYYLSFILLGIIINSPVKRSDDIESEGAMPTQYAFRSVKERFWKDVISGVVCFILYMVMSILPYVTEFYNTASKTIILSIRILSLVPWVGTLIYVYKSVMSEKISELTTQLPKLTIFIAGLCPGAIILTLIRYSHQLGILAALIAMPIMAYILSVLWRFSIRLLKGLCTLLLNKEFGWKEIFIGSSN